MELPRYPTIRHFKHGIFKSCKQHNGQLVSLIHLVGHQMESVLQVIETLLVR